MNNKVELVGDKYKEICDYCDSVLLHQDSTKHTVAINWLHVPREHPSYLKEYACLTASNNHNLYEKIKKNIVEDIFPMISSAYGLFKSVSLVVRNQYITKPTIDRCDILFVSHLVNVDHLEDEDDFYFGDLPNSMKEFNLSSMTAMINHLDKYDIDKVEKHIGNITSKVVLSKTLGLFKELSIFYGQLLEYKRLRKCMHNSRGLLKVVYGKACQESISPRTLTTIRIAVQIKKLIRHASPRAVITTCEGHAWERLVYFVAREVNPNIKCFAYQHVAVFPLQHSMKRRLLDLYNPSHIFTSGKVSKRQLDGSKGLDGIPISVLGSKRHLKKKTKQNINKINTCLVITDGFIEECQILFDFSYECALKMPEKVFIWRVHPTLNIRKIINNIGFKELPKNIVLSSCSLDNDISASSHVLYRGSTVVIQSIIGGLNPFYLRIKGELTIDPLYELNYGRTIINSVNEFICLFDAVIDSGEMNEMVEYCKEFYTPLNGSVLRDMVINL